MSNHPTLPFGFTAHDGSHHIEPDDDTRAVIRINASGRVHVMDEYSACDGDVAEYSNAEEQTAGYFLATSAQLAALPSLLELVSRLSNLNVNPLSFDHATKCIKDAKRIMSKIGGE